MTRPEITRCTCGAWAIQHQTCDTCGQPALDRYNPKAWT